MNSRIENVHNHLQQKIGLRQSLVDQLQNLQNNLDEAESTLDEYSKIKKVFEVLIRSTEVSLRRYIEPVINESLDFVFNQTLFFHLVFCNRRNQLEVDFLLLRNYETEKEFQEFMSNPSQYEKEIELLVKDSRSFSDSFGGAVSQVLSCVLRFILAELLKIEGPICMDEPTSAFHPLYAERFGQLVSSLSKRFNRQYIIITHSMELAAHADKCYIVEQRTPGISSVMEDVRESNLRESE